MKKYVPFLIVFWEAFSSILLRFLVLFHKRGLTKIIEFICVLRCFFDVVPFQLRSLVGSVWLFFPSMFDRILVPKILKI